MNSEPLDHPAGCCQPSLRRILISLFVLSQDLRLVNSSAGLLVMAWLQIHEIFGGNFLHAAQHIPRQITFAFQQFGQSLLERFKAIPY